MSLYRPKFIKEWSNIKSEGGYKLLLKKKGWQVIFFFFTSLPNITSIFWSPVIDFIVDVIAFLKFSKFSTFFSI